MKETVTETKVVEEQREITICDYCKLVSEKDIDEDEAFSEILLNVDYRNRRLDATLRTHCERLARMNSPEQIAHHLQSELLTVEGTADLCPYCVDDLFGDGPASMIRDGEARVSDLR